MHTPPDASYRVGMLTWPRPYVPELPGTGIAPTVYDTRSANNVTLPATGQVSLYVCGLTPYDAAHLGHAATYLTYDLLYRAWQDAGAEVKYVQNVTDVDDPLLERATATGVAWEELAHSQLNVYTQDMAALGIIPPDHLIGVTESLEDIAAAVAALTAKGRTYTIEVTDHTAVTDGAADVYARFVTDPDREALADPKHVTAKEFAARGGDPDRPGKEHPLDPLVWRAARAGEPAWVFPGVPAGRPGWHIECSVISTKYLGPTIDVQGGGTDLVFPHHEMSATHSHALTGKKPFASCYIHAAMVHYDGKKMSKSTGNLVFVHDLIDAGADPMAIRLALLAHHHRTDWEWTDADLTAGTQRFTAWRTAFARPAVTDPTPVVTQIRAALANDLDAPTALAAVDAWVAAQDNTNDTATYVPGALSRAVDALLGVRF